MRKLWEMLHRRDWKEILHDNHMINWPASTILDRESDKSTRWIKEGTQDRGGIHNEQTFQQKPACIKSVWAEQVSTDWSCISTTMWSIGRPPLFWTEADKSTRWIKEAVFGKKDGNPWTGKRGITIVARTRRGTEQTSSYEGLWQRPKHQGKNVGCVEVIVFLQ